MNPSVSRVVIVGGGFAGLFAARELRRAPVQPVTVKVNKYGLNRDRLGNHR